MIPLVSVVFPLPRSPLNRTRTGGRSFPAISLPFAIVSSEECETNSLTAMFPLRQNVRVGFRNRFDQVRSNHPRLPDARRRDIAREAMQVNPKTENVRPIFNPKLRRQPR